MRLRYTLLLLTAVASLYTHAQVGKYRNDMAIGVNAGIVMNKVSFSPTVMQGMKMGPQFGITFRYTCEKYFAAVCAFQAELNYSMKGWKENITTSDDTYQRNLNYIELPLLARLGFGRERKGFMGFVVLGPQLGFCISDSEQKGGEWSDLTLSHRQGITAQYGMPIQKKFDYGITAGAGIEYSVPKVGHFLLEGRYYFGLGDMYNNSKKDVFSKSANSSIYVKVAYLFDVIKTKNMDIK